MKVVTTLHQPSAVVSSVRCKLASNYELGHLAVAKTNRIEVSSIHAEGLKYECSLEIWGRVLSVCAVPGEAEGVSNLLVLTDHPYPKLIVLSLNINGETRELKEEWSSDLYDRNARHAEYLNDIVVHPAGRAAVVSCYAGKLKVLIFKKGEKVKDFDVILPELNLLALSFLYYEPNAHTHTLAILHIDHRQRTQLLARELDVKERDLSVEIAHAIPHTILPANHFPFTELPLKLVSVPAFSLAQTPDREDADASAKCRGGVIVLGGRKVNFYELSDKKTVRDLKSKAQRQSKRRASGNVDQIRIADEKDAARELKKVKPRATVKWPWSEVAAICPADDEMRKFFVGDAFGRLSFLSLSSAPEFIIIPLGETSPATTISHLSSQFLYVGSVLGDSQVLRISPAPVSDIDADTLPIPGGIQTIKPAELSAPRAESPDDDYDMRDAFDTREGRGGKIVRTKGCFLEVLSRMRNIAPILDVVLADPDESGQPQIITCSGGANTGSLNVVRTGADFLQLASLQGIDNVKNIWPIRTNFEATSDAFVLTSRAHDSALLRFDDRESVTGIDPSATGFITNEPTIAVANIPRRTTSPQGTSAYADSSLVVQITPSGLNLVEYDAATDSFIRVAGGWFTKEQENSPWRGREITAASINPSQFVVALDGGSLLLFNLSPEGRINFFQSREFPGRNIARVSCAPLDPTKNFSLFIAVSFWGANTVALLSTKDPARPLSTHVESSPLPAFTHSLLLHNFGTGNTTRDADFQPYVVAGLADGTVACLSFRNNELHEPKLFSLGTTPVSLSVSNIDGNRAVLATGSRSSVFLWERQRLRQSLVMLKNIPVGVGLNTPAYPSCQMLATPTSLVIGQIRGVDKMQIRTIPMGCENPRRITYHPTHNVFGVSLVKCAPARVGEAELQESVFRVVDGITFDTISTFLADPDEEVSAVLALPAATDANDSVGSFVVGTVRHQHGEFEPSLGRLILFDLVKADRGERELRKVTEAEVRGCVYALAIVENGIAVAVNTSVELYAAVRHDTNIALNRVASWNHNYFVTSLVAKGDRLIVGDAISSVSVLEVKDNNLKSIARDYGPVWPVALEATNDGGVIGANTDGNLFTFALPEGGGARAVLERTGSYHLGELVNAFVPTSSATAEHAPFETEQLFATSSGRLALVHHVAHADVALSLTALQRNMSELLTGPGETRHAQWRTPANARGRSDAEDNATGFLDGDFLEAFLTHPEREKVLAGRNDAERIDMSVEQVERILEKLQSLH